MRLSCPAARRVTVSLLPIYRVWHRAFGLDDVSSRQSRQAGNIRLLFSIILCRYDFALPPRCPKPSLISRPCHAFRRFA